MRHIHEKIKPTWNTKIVVSYPREMRINGFVLNPPQKGIEGVLSWCCQIASEFVSQCGLWRCRKSRQSIKNILWRVSIKLLTNFWQSQDRTQRYEDIYLWNVSHLNPISQCLHTPVQIQSEWSLQQLHAIPPAMQLEWNRQVCDLDEELEDWNGNWIKVNKERLTNGDAVQFRVVCVWVIFVEKFFAHCDSSLDAWFVAVIVSGCGEVLVNMIHCQDHLCEVGCCTREKWSSIFKNLENHVRELQSNRNFDYSPSEHLPARGHRHRKKRPGVNFFFKAAFSWTN